MTLVGFTVRLSRILRSWPSSTCSHQGALSALGNIAQGNVFRRHYSSESRDDDAPKEEEDSKPRATSITVCNTSYKTDRWTNVTPQILDKVEVKLHNKRHHPLCLIKQRIQNYFYSNYLNRHGNPMYAVFDNLVPVVTTQQNFDSLLTPEDHISRSMSDTYYVNSQHLLRGHTSAHQVELVRMGFDAFLVVGDVYRRDEINATHYPVFHQLEAVRLFTEAELFSRLSDPSGLSMFEEGKRYPDKQQCHSMDAAKLMEYDLKETLLGLTRALFGHDVQHRWVDAYFPFTHPSWELEIWHEGEWMEVLGSGIMEQTLLTNAGASKKIGWAAGLGLERLAMKLYSIPDIRLFWSQDPGFLNQFKVDYPDTPITYKAISKFAPCINDIAFWIHEDFCSNDFYDLVRSEGGDLVEQVHLVDEFTHPRHRRTSHCYRVVYRHMERTLTQTEVNQVHGRISVKATRSLGVELR